MEGGAGITAVLATGAPATSGQVVVFSTRLAVASLDDHGSISNSRHSASDGDAPPPTSGHVATNQWALTAFASLAPQRRIHVRVRTHVSGRARVRPLCRPATSPCVLKCARICQPQRLRVHLAWGASTTGSAATRRRPATSPCSQTDFAFSSLDAYGIIHVGTPVAVPAIFQAHGCCRPFPCPTTAATDR